jgi:ethanolamine permease
MVIGIIALLTGETSEIITISVFGALTLYIVSMISFLQLRKNEPHLVRPFKVPWYPVFPLTALVIAIISFVAMTIFNSKLAIIYFLLMGICYLTFKVLKK